jgi:hypothetical protein
MVTQALTEVTMRTAPVLRTAAILATLSISAACNDPFDPPASDPSAGTLTIIPRMATIHPGEVALLRASLKDEFGDAIETNLQWTSSNDAVATVSATGSVLGRSAGRVVITANALGKSQTSVVQVLARTQKKDSGDVQ